MNLLEPWRILKSVFRHLSSLKKNPLTLRQMAWFYLLKKIYLYPSLSAIQIPFAIAESNTPPPSPIAVIVHCYYPDLMEELLTYIQNIPYPYRLYVSTDTEEKRYEIIRLIDQHQIPTSEVRLAPNRGRDIAPKYVTFHDVYQHCEYFLHLHSKKTVQASAWGEKWRRHLLRTLVGSPDIIRSNLRLLADPRIGLVFPVPLYDILPEFRWGDNFTECSILAHRLQVEIDPKFCLDYPQGSMFWSKAEAIRPLLDLQLRSEDFPIEKGQWDGTLHHAMERMIAYSARKQGLAACRVSVTTKSKARQGFESESRVDSAISASLASQERERRWFK